MTPVPVMAAAEGIPPLFALLALMLAGYFICGVLIANSGVLALLGAGESHVQVSQMAEFGVVLLMFTLGLEFSLGELRFLRRLAFVGGGWQMALCMVVVAVVSTLLHS
jgi:CPA2 family monovalent cation:H+ antiporter-2